MRPEAEKDVSARADEQNENYDDLEKAHPDTDVSDRLPEAAAVQVKAVSTKGQ